MHPNAAARHQFSIWESRVRSAFYAEDSHLQSLIRHYDRTGLDDALQTYGPTIAALDGQVRENNRDEHLPRLRRLPAHQQRRPVRRRHRLHGERPVQRGRLQRRRQRKLDPPASKF